MSDSVVVHLRSPPIVVGGMRASGPGEFHSKATLSMMALRLSHRVVAMAFSPPSSARWRPTHLPSNSPGPKRCVAMSRSWCRSRGGRVYSLCCSGVRGRTLTDDVLRLWCAVVRYSAGYRDGSELRELTPDIHISEGYTQIRDPRGRAQRPLGLMLEK